MIEVAIDPSLSGLATGLVVAEGVEIGTAGAELQAYCDDATQRVLAADAAGGDFRRDAVRQLLRAGGFKPAGRNKPAQEYLLRSVRQQGELPHIFNAVDLLNAISLEAGLPISLAAVQRVGTQLTLRYGRPGERFVFNQAGQELDVNGLICLCGEGPQGAFGSPVKDSMLAKVREDDRHVFACIYAPRDDVSRDELHQWSQRLGRGLATWCNASAVRTWLLPESESALGH